MSLLKYAYDAQLSPVNVCEQTSLSERHVCPSKTVVTQLPENQAVHMQYESGLNNTMYRRIDVNQYQQVESASSVLSLAQSVYSGLCTKEIVSTQAFSFGGSIYYHRGNTPKMLEYVTDKTRIIVSGIRSTQDYCNYLEYSSRTYLPNLYASIPSGMISFVIDNEILQSLIRNAEFSILNAKISNVLGAIQNLNNQIKTKTLYDANFLVMSPKVCNILTDPGPSKIPDWMWNTAKLTYFGSGVCRVGTLNSKFDVYVAPIMGNTILLGYNGNNRSKTGTVFVPNVMLTTYTSGVYIPKYTFNVVRPAFYAKANLQDF